MTTTNTVELKFVFTSPNKPKPVLKDMTVRSQDELYDLLVLAQAWADEEMSGKKGRKAHVFSPGHFAMNTVDGIINWWLPNKGEKLIAKLPDFTPEPEIDYAI